MKTILFYPKLHCEVGCEYCFQDERDKKTGYDIPKMLERARKLSKPSCGCGQNHGPDQKGKKIVMHGGELLKLPISDLTKMVEGLNEFYKSITLQTSLHGLSGEHVELFKKYNMNLGVSVDGPPELNQLRGPRDGVKNKIYQNQLVMDLQILREEKIKFGCITVLTKFNSVGTNLDKLLNWVQEFEISGRFNPMFTPNWTGTEPNELELTPQELKIAWIELAKIQKREPQLHILPIKEFANNLLGNGLAPCIVCRCDYLSTHCTMITPDGNLSRCDRCLQDGLNYIKLPNASTNIRSEVLKQTECKDCRYFTICGGGCPGEGINGDMRRKTKFCEAYCGLYNYLEDNLRMIPNSRLSIDVKNYYEEYFLKNRKLSQDQNQGQGNWRSDPHSGPGHEDTWG